MSNYSIREKCKVNTNRDTDTFVGIMCKNGDFSVHFPLGFNISEDEKELRKEILLLIHTIARTTRRKDSEIYNVSKGYNVTNFPIQAYISLIYDYFAMGYYQERDVMYFESTQGKINWSRTIKTQKPNICDGDAYYLKYITKNNHIKKNQLITLIHEYCVYESFQKIGWLFTELRVPKPRIKYNEKLFKSVVLEKLQHTFNDRNKKLFVDMLAIIDNMSSDCTNINYKYGTYRFEYVWEALIDRVYGVANKNTYFPKTTWKVQERCYDNACLEPDTIMICGENIYVLDSKYYKYGQTGKPCDLPESASINKQITYGEYIANEKKFKEIHGSEYKVFNVFILPYDGKKHESGKLSYIGEAKSDWKFNDKEYERVQGILVDIKYIMQLSAKQDMSEIMELAEFIEDNICKEH